MSMIIVYSLDQLWLFYSLQVDGPLLAYAFSLCALTEPLVHLYICLIYLKVALEVKFLLNKKIYLENYETLREFHRGKKRLKWFFIVNVGICILLGLLTLFAYTIFPLGILAFSSDILFIILQLGYLLVWVWALWRLYRNVQQAKDLLPNKRIFFIHGSLLVLYILGVMGDTILSQMPNWLGCGEACFYKWRAMGQISIVVGNYAESASFLLVIYVLSPITRKQHKNQQNFQEFLMNGLVDHEKLEEAVLAANPNITPFEKEMLLESLSRVKEFFRATRDSQRLIASMIEQPSIDS
jgi:hypothetical protein